MKNKQINFQRLELFKLKNDCLVDEPKIMFSFI